MKKILLITLLIVVVLCAGCAKRGEPSLDPKNPGSTDQPQPSPTIEPVVEVGEEVTKEDVYLLDETGAKFTAETLPDEYQSADFDCDSLKNRDEIKYGSDMYKVDTDGDGISDYDEVDKTKTDPVKWSSRDDGVSDLEWFISQEKDFSEGFSSINAFGFQFYQAKPADRIGYMSKTSVVNFDELNTITEALVIKAFSGKLAFNASRYTEDVAQSIKVFKADGTTCKEIQTTVNENRQVVFEVSENDVIVAACVEQT